MAAPPPERRLGAGPATLGAAAWVASVVAAAGFISLLTGDEVLPVARAGPLAVPVGVAIAAIAIAVRAARATGASVLLPLELLLIGYLVPLVGAVLVALLTGPDAALLTAARLAVSPFAVADGLLGGAAGLVLLLLVRATAAGAQRPRWPWERDDER